jgi:PRTRC genetic system ThiF family protein
MNSIMLPTDKVINIDVVGCGGTGSQVLSGLARIHNAIRSCGHAHGLFVRAYDPDIVTNANVGRQLFHGGDVGLGKAECLVRRLNLFFQVHWNWSKTRWHGNSRADMVIVCIDTGKGRKQIQSLITTDQYVIDCGNEMDFGQVVIGGRELSSPYEEIPALTTSIHDDATPSCSLAEAVSRQDLFINQAVATHALNIVWKMMRYGSLDYRGVFINLKSGNTKPIEIKNNDS